MINLDATDVLEGIASVDAVIKFTVSGRDATDGFVSKEGAAGNTNTEFYTAVGTTLIYSVTLYNSHSSAVTLTLNKDPANAGTLYTYFSVSLGIGYSLVFDGQRCTVLDASGNLLTSFANLISDAAYGAGWNGVTTIAPSKNAVYDKIETLAPIDDPTFTTKITTPTINLTGGQIAFPATAVPSADPNTMDDYEEGSFSVTLSCSTSGTITINTSYDTLSYIKIGPIFIVQGYLTVSSVNSPAGGLIINGMVFTSADLAEGSGRAAISIGIISTASNTDGAPIGIITEGATTISVYEQTRLGTALTLAGYIDAGSVIYVGGSYRVA